MAVTELRPGLKVVLMVLIGITVLSGCTQAGPKPGSHPSLWLRQGVFGITDARDIATTSHVGADLVVTGWPGPSGSVDDASRAHRVAVIDRSVQSMLYLTRCPDGPGSCSQLSVAQRISLLDRVREHVQSIPVHSEVAGIYLVDDYWTDMRRDLQAVADTIRMVSSLPLVCGISVPLAVRPEGQVEVRPDVGAVERSLLNYDPRWCDVVLLYAYAPSSGQSERQAVEWNMQSTLPEAMSLLRDRGWAGGRWIAGIQTFGDAPRVQRDGSLVYRPAPSEGDIVEQMTAMCEAGARATVAYTWNDGQPGTIQNLSNSSWLRTGWQLGRAACQRVWAREG
jgi:hypothetical protein